MHFLGIEIGHSGTRPVVLDSESPVMLTEAWAYPQATAFIPLNFSEAIPTR
jgi:hypothetical protein